MAYEKISVEGFCDLFFFGFHFFFFFFFYNEDFKSSVLVS